MHAIPTDRRYSFCRDAIGEGEFLDESISLKFSSRNGVMNEHWIGIVWKKNRKKSDENTSIDRMKVVPGGKGVASQMQSLGRVMPCRLGHKLFSKNHFKLLTTGWCPDSLLTQKLFPISSVLEEMSVALGRTQQGCGALVAAIIITGRRTEVVAERTRRHDKSQFRSFGDWLYLVTSALPSRSRSGSAFFKAIEPKSFLGESDCQNVGHTFATCHAECWTVHIARRDKVRWEIYIDLFREKLLPKGICTAQLGWYPLRMKGVAKEYWWLFESKCVVFGCNRAVPFDPVLWIAFTEIGLMTASRMWVFFGISKNTLRKGCYWWAFAQLM